MAPGPSGGRRSSRGGWQRRLSRNVPTVVGLLMLAWLVFITTSNFRSSHREDRRVQVTVRASGKLQSRSQHRSAGLDGEGMLRADFADEIGVNGVSQHQQEEAEEVEEVEDEADDGDMDPASLPEAPEGSVTKEAAAAGSPMGLESAGAQKGASGAAAGSTAARGDAVQSDDADEDPDEDPEGDEEELDELEEDVTPQKGREKSENPSSPRYKVSWDIKSFINTVSDIEKFVKSDFYYPEERMIVTHENFLTIVREKKMSQRTGRALPKTYPYPRSKENGKIKQPFGTCALVGNSGVMQQQRFGRIIDAHDAVMRINQGPVQGYKSIVGGRTTWRLLNKKWVSMYITKLEGRGILIPNESRNATYLASRTGRGSFERLAGTVKRLRPDITTYWLSQGVQNRAYKLLAAFRNAASKIQGTKYTGGDAPSSGLIALTFLLQVCDKIAVYGLSSEKSTSTGTRTTPYHYFFFKSHQELHLDSLQLRVHPSHSFEAEGDLIRILSRGDRVKYCSDPTVPTSKLSHCGWAYEEDE